MKRILQSIFRKPLRRAVRVLEEKSRNRSAFARAENVFEKWVSERRFTEPTESNETPLKEMGLTSSELASFCKWKYGKTFLTVRKELRIREACRLMQEHPESKIGEIGHLVGIDDPSNFRHQFKSVEGVTPSEWKENQKKIRKSLEIV